MKNIGNFIVGSMSTLGLNASINNIDTASTLPSTIIDSVEAIVSLIGGVLSTVIVAWIKNKLQKQSKRKKRDKS
ncbi:hypothetical protein EYV94_20715 [Puteibacter caeruleilacunae]|nr:hypothetical protein EYV94_20715 [Puteibacter caeruleilacunae]